MRDLRTYLAGLGSSGALVGAVIAGFLALGAIPAQRASLENEVDETVTDSTGLDLDLGGKTGDVTDVVDGAVGGLTGGRDVNLPELKP